MSDAFLILSSRYIASDLVSEFGELPPAMLPVGMRRLFEKQIEFAQEYTKNIYLTIPSNYVISDHDRLNLSADNVQVVRLDPGLTLSEAVLGGMAVIGNVERLLLLFGDTLIEYDKPSEPDSFAVGVTRHFAMWADYQADAAGGLTFREALPTQAGARVVCGLFDFADGGLLGECLNGGVGFYAALSAYAMARRLTPKPTKQWLDFGHLQTYYQSRKEHLGAREFNHMKVEGFTLTKTGSPPRKIFAEALWYKNAPKSVKPFLPQLVDISTSDPIKYEIEYLYLPSVAELFCFSELTPPVWRNIIDSCISLLELCQQTRPCAHEVTDEFPGHFFLDLFGAKTSARIEKFADQSGISADNEWTINGRRVPSLRKLADLLVSAISTTNMQDICFWHGDYHFANLLYDFRSQKVKCIDPRGMLSDGTLTIFGDPRYDIAKISHSVVGLYDLIISGRFDLNHNSFSIDMEFDISSNIKGIQIEFMQRSCGKWRIDSSENLAMTALLFVSMLPLHSDKPRRQMAMLANAYRIAKLGGVI